MPKLLLRIISICLFVCSAGGALADDANSALAAAQCEPGDQLPCSCPTDKFPAQWPNPLIKPCFVGGVNRQSEGQTEQFGARVFGSLNWPLGKTRGVPDYDSGPAASKLEAKLDFATVWESWPSTRAIFRADGTEPGDWETSATPLPAACAALSIDDAKAEFKWANVPESTQKPRLLDEYLNPNGQALIDLAGRPVRYEILFNRQAFEYVTANKLWSAQDLDDYIAANGKLEFPAGTWPDDDDTKTVRGAIIAKAAWKILDVDWDNPDHFHKSWAYISPLVENGKVYHGCKIVPVGLAGLHATMKTDLFPDWLWMTYEHFALAPTWEEIGLTEKGGVVPRYPERPADEFAAGADDASWAWMFYTPQVLCASSDADCKPPSRLNHSKPGEIPAEPSRIVRMQGPGYYDPHKVEGVTCAEANEARKFIIMDSKEKDSKKYAIPISDQQIPPDVDRLNCMLSDGYANSVFQFYQLKGTQWIDPKATENGAAIRKLSPEILGNASMESFNQLDSSCIACHQNSRPASSTENIEVFDYIFSFDRDVMARASGTATGETLPAGN